MEQSDQKTMILPIGTLGVGKSTLMNCILGQDEHFPTSSAPQSCTQDFSIKDVGQRSIIDSPGLNDPKWPLSVWLETIKRSQIQERRLQLCLLVIMQKPRPDTLDKQNLVVMEEVVKDLKPENIAVVFTHCDLNPVFTKQKGKEFIDYTFETLQQNTKIDLDHIFLFKGKGIEMYNVAKTSQNEVVEWLQSITPQNECQMNPEPSLINIGSRAAATGDQELIRMLQTQIEEMKKTQEILIKNQEQQRQQHDQQFQAMQQTTKDLKDSLAQKNVDMEKLIERQREALQFAQANQGNSGGSGGEDDGFHIHIPCNIF